MDNPLVSVLMTAYNREKYIGEAIESVLASTYTNFELIIVDDCSTDKTVEIARRYEAKNERVRVYVNEVNLGQFPNRNKAIEFAKGFYIKYFDSDDIMNPDCLQTMVEAMMQFPEAMAGAEQKINLKNLPTIYGPRQLYLNHYLGGNDMLTVGPSALIFKKEVLKIFGGFDINIGILADTLLMLQIAARYPVVAYQPYTFHWRRHDEQVTVGQDDIYAMTIQRKRINDIVLDSSFCPLSAKERVKLKRNQKNIMVRNLFKYCIKGQFEISGKIFENASLSIKDIFLSIFPNYKLRKN